MNGILNIDKPQGMTSHDVVARVRRLAQMRRVGHAGTLDPLATGVLVLALGRATRLLEYVVGQPKEYVTTVRLGQITDSYDADGTVVAEHPVAVTEAQLQTALQAFIGTIEQVPPMFSAIKKDGQPLYKLARQGVTVERKPRTVTISALELVERNGNDVELHVACSTGTYIRSLAHDLGQLLGCGGHVVVLRRTQVGRFESQKAIGLDVLTGENISRYLHPPDTAISHLPRLVVPEDEARLLSQGKWIVAESNDNNLVRCYDSAEKFVGILRRENNHWRPHKIFYF